MRIDPGAEPFLIRHGFGRIRRDTLKEQNGRNNNFLVVTDEDRPLFVKRIRPDSSDAQERLAACVAFEQLRRDDPAVRSDLGTAPLLAWDEDQGFLAYEAVHGSASLAERVPDLEQEEVLRRADECGRFLAAVHALDVEGVPSRAHEPALPPVDWLSQLPWAIYLRSTAPTLQVWHRLQGDAEVADALRRLREDERAAPMTAIHGDARLDQFLLGGDGVLRLIDLEEFRAGDSARDVGAMVGEWLHRATLELVAETGTETAILEVEMTHEDVLRQGTAAIEQWRPAIERFWTSYRSEGGGGAEPAYVHRVTRFAGWHLFDRLIAASEFTSRLGAVQWAAAGIGRQALLHPESAAPVLGLSRPAKAQEEAA